MRALVPHRRRAAGGAVVPQHIHGERYLQEGRESIVPWSEPPSECSVSLIMQDTDRGLTERRITVLHQVAFDLQTADTIDEICERTVQAAEDVLEFDNCIVSLERGGELPIQAKSSAIPGDGVTESMDVDEGIAGQTYRTGNSYVIDNVETVDAAKPQGPYTSCLSIPIGDIGILQAVSEEPAFFSETDRELAELLVTHTANAISRVEHRQELEQFAHVISHDLRNPLNVASGRLELARAEGSSESLDQIGIMLDRMDTLLEELLVLAKQGDVVSELTPVDLERAIDTGWETVATADGVLIPEFTSPVCIEADETRLRQLLENLFRNAIEHTDHDVTVRVGTLDNGFYVEDDGPGIPEEERVRIFDRGYSANKGSGLGLHIVEKIADAHGWNVTVSTGTDGGALFEITNVSFV